MTVSPSVLRNALQIAAILASTTSWAADATHCADSLERAALLNANQLFDAAANCGIEKQPFGATLLMIEGQIRAMADMELLAPKTDQDQLLAAQLYGKIFYVAGGAGDREVYRDSAKATDLFQRIERWTPVLPENYDPGWQYKKLPTAAAYTDSIDYSKSYRVAQLKGYAALVRNEQYYAAETELGEIQRRNPKGIETGSSDGARVQELSHSMSRISGGIAQPALPKPRPFVYKPDPDADFKQVLVGFNGPEGPGITVMRSESDVAGSWLASAISEDDLKRILSDVHFDSQILVAFAVGKRESATGQLFVTTVSYSTLINSFTVAARVGVNEPGCGFSQAKSYPFAVIIATRPPKIPGGSGYDVGNFGDGCKQPQSGNPSPSPAAPKP